MRDFYQVPLMTCYAQYLECNLGYKLDEPSDMLKEFAAASESESMGYVYGDQYTLAHIVWLLNEKLGVDAIWHGYLTPDEEAVANKLIASTTRKTNHDTSLYGYDVCMLEIRRSQDLCDELTRAIYCAPFLPESVVTEAHMRGIGHAKYGFYLDKMEQQLPIADPEGRAQTPAEAEEARRVVEMMRALYLE